MSADFRPRVNISLTSIPSRINRILKESLLDLVQQDYEHLDKIYLTVPMENMRGQVMDEHLPEWLQEEPFVSKVVVVRPEKDYGPIMKWIGAAQVLPEDCWVFVCDDDVRYNHGYISHCVEEATKVAPEERERCLFNSKFFTEQTHMYNIDLIWGVHGVFVPRSFLATVDEKFDRSLPTCCLHIDDDVVSVIARDHGYRKVLISSGLDMLQAIKDSLMQPDGLGTSYNKISDRHKCHSKMNPEYSDNLLIVVVVLSAVTFALVVAVLVFGYIVYRRRSHNMRTRKDNTFSNGLDSGLRDTLAKPKQK
jgi:hypothetical protein